MWFSSAFIKESFPKIWIKYKENQPILIDSQYAKRPDGGPIQTVIDLISVFFPTATPETLGQYTLHSVDQGVASEALKPDLLIKDLTNGLTFENSLLIKSNRGS